MSSDRANQEADAQPFDGIRVVEFGQFVAVPFAAQLLAEGGAEVIKIESLEGDPTRRLAQLAPMESRIYLSRNRGKRSLPLHLRHERAPQIIDALLGRADVALMNFRPGLAAQFGLDAETLRAKYPRLIVASVTPFGRYGPDAGLAGMDIVVQARSGLMVANGRQGDGRPLSGDPVSADYMAAMSLAFGIASALFRRANTGQGAEVHASLMQAAMTLNNNQMLRVESADSPVHEESRQELADMRSRGATYSEQRMAQPSARARIMADIYFRTYTTSDGWLAVACGSTRLRAAFSLAIGLEDEYTGDDPNHHAEHYEHLREAAEAIMQSRPTDEWEALLAEAGVPASRVLMPFEILDDPQAAANDMLYDLDHPQIGPVRLLAPPVALDEHGFQQPQATKPFASETLAILVELGFVESEIDQFVESGVTRDSIE
ncbi:MAG: CoA transferase [Chloroflexi bacterium]|nr:CoA transferase [Chloroflexota bacterium]MYF21694.1 CoA transferase [Chloroflexota bacterium]